MFNQTNTFQAVIASNGSLTYSVFTYKCGLIRDFNLVAAVGYSAKPNFYQYYPPHNLINISCVNQPASNWSNVVYEIGVCSAPCVNGRYTNTSTCNS